MSTNQIIILLCCTLAKSQNPKFPPGFKFGVSTASYQIEGGWNAGGKGENIWDRLTHTHPELIADHSNGDVACDSYDQWPEDVQILKSLGVDHYRFSLSWTRLLPGGFSNHYSQNGVDYYDSIIDALIENGIEPMVTLYHWDLPQSLQTLGGWTNPELAGYFEDFADFAFATFGDRVKTWITINEPASICVDTYEYDKGAPAFMRLPGIGLYLCGKTILLAHAKAYRLYDSVYRKSQGGKVGITIDSIWAEPATNKSEDVEAARREMQMQLGWWAHPVFSTAGDYPAVMKSRIAANSKSENFPASRLPALNPKQIELILGSADFFGLNHYHTWLITDRELPANSTPSYQKDRGTAGTPQTASWGFTKLLNWVKSEYGNPLVIITENGYGDGGGLQDHERVLFISAYLKALLDAVMAGCNVTGYTLWSLMDNMEWRSGYTVKFGLYQVNFTDPKRTRQAKMSASFYKNVIKTHSLPQK